MSPDLYYAGGKLHPCWDWCPEMAGLARRYIHLAHQLEAVVLVLLVALVLLAWRRP